MLYRADWIQDTELAELHEVTRQEPGHVVDEYGKSPLEAWRLLATRQLRVAHEKAISYDDKHPEPTHHEMSRAKAAIDFYFKSWTEAMES